MRIRPSVKREKHPRFNLFGPSRWWTVYLTPWQPIASFASFKAAFEYAQLMAVAVNRENA